MGFEESSGSLWGRVVAAPAPGSDVWASSRVGCDLTWQLAVWWDVLRRYPCPTLLLQGPGQVSAVHSEEKVIAVIVYTGLGNYPLDVVASLYFHPWLWFCPVCAWNRLGRIFFYYFGGVSGFFLACFILFAQSLFCCPSFSAKHVLSLASLSNIVYN